MNESNLLRSTSFALNYVQKIAKSLKITKRLFFVNMQYAIAKNVWLFFVNSLM